MFCPKVWRKIFLVVASGMLISHVKQIVKQLCVSHLLRKQSGDSWSSKMFLTKRHGTSTVVVVAVVFGTALCQGDLFAETAPVLEAKCPGMSVGAYSHIHTVLPATASCPLLTASKIPLTRGGISLLLTPVWTGRCAEHLQSH